MNAALDQFRINLNQVRQLISLYAIVELQTKGLVDPTDILRAAFVFGVSVLDFYVHELVRLGMLEVHQGKRAATKGFLRFSVSVESTRLAVANPIDARWLDDEIRSQHGWKSFQQPENITKALRLISDKRFWESVASAMGAAGAAEVKTRLALIADRRNKIAHEADMDPTYPGSRWPIDRHLVEDALVFIERFAENVFVAIS